MPIRSLVRSALLLGLATLLATSLSSGGRRLLTLATGDVALTDTAGAAKVSSTRAPSPRRPRTAALGVAPAESSALAALSSGLLVPVVGVLPAALRDGFTEPRSGHVHQAIDIMAPRGTPVVAAADGRLLRLHRSRAGGLMVYAADAADRFILMYGHLDAYAPGLANGASLRRGQLLGYVGTTGNAPANTPHLHFAISEGRPSVRWWKGTPVNPYPLLAHGTSLASLPSPRLDSAGVTTRGRVKGGQPASRAVVPSSARPALPPRALPGRTRP